MKDCEERQLFVVTAVAKGSREKLTALIRAFLREFMQKELRPSAVQPDRWKRRLAATIAMGRYRPVYDALFNELLTY
jgi:undecaprenyl pyrophosphate synthase